MNIYLLSAWSEQHANEWHLGNLHSLQHSAAMAKSEHRLVRDPKYADIVLFADCGPLPIGFSVLLHPVWWRYNHKCFVYDEQDFPCTHFRGLFSSLDKNSFNHCMHHGAAYIREEIGAWTKQLSFPECAKYLYSFCGALETHSVRQKLMDRLSGLGYIIDVPRSVTQAAFVRGDTQAIADLRAQLEAVCRDSLFVLCPRGVGASSIRLFEVMSMGRAPVIISDEWIPPYGADWDTFSVRVLEAEIEKIPSILAGYEPMGQKMGREARKAWERWYSPNRHFDTSVMACIDLMENKSHCAFSWQSLLKSLISTRGLRTLVRFFSKLLVGGI